MSFNETTILCSLDLSNAYDKVNIPMLLNKMVTYGIPNKYINYCYNLLINRELKFTTGNGTVNITRVTNRGLPQGCVLSPLLFSIYIAHINQCLPREVHSQQYADDIIIYSSSKSIVDVKANIQIGLDNLDRNFVQSFMDFNPNKSNVIVFSRKKTFDSVQENNIEFHINNDNIPVVECIKLLGVIIDNKLNFKKHIKHIANQSTADLNILKAIACGKKGAQPHYILRVYQSLIRSKLDYCSFLFGHVAKGELKKLDIIQNTALRIALGAFKSTPVIAMQAEAQIIPLQIRRQMLTERLVYKVASDVNHPTHNNLVYLKLLTEELPYWAKKKKPIHVTALNNIYTVNPNFYRNFKEKTHNDFEKPIWMVEQIKGSFQKLDLGVKKDLAIHPAQFFYEQINSTYKNYTQIFTDGARNSQGVGCAFWIPSLNIEYKFKLNKFMSSYTAELIAILKAVQYAITLDFQYIIICTDSLASVNALHSFAFMAKGNALVINIMHEIVRSKKNIIVYWVPGHVGIHHNELVDKLAKDSILDGYENIEVNVPYNDFNSYLKGNAFLKHNVQFQTSPKASWYKSLENNVPRNKWFSNIKWNRQNITNILRIRFGHARTNSTLFKIKQYFTPLCLKCTLSEQETLDHLILKCPNYQYARDKCFKTIDYRNNTLLNIIKNTRLDFYQEIIHFLNLTKTFL